jgi:hypothetical protein
MYLPTILVGVLAGQAAVGLFGAAHRIVMVFQTMLEVYFRNLFPTMSQAARTSAEHLARLLRNSMWLVMVPALALALATTLVAPTLISLIFGESYMQPGAIGVLAVLIWLIPILAWRRHSRNALITLNRQRDDWRCSLIGIVLLVSLIVPLTRIYGGLGSAWAMVVSELATAALAWWLVRRRLPNLEPPWRPEEPVSPSRLSINNEEAATGVSSRTSENELNPIFIVGAPRSGTSLLRVMLNRHPSIGLCDETYYFYYVYSRRSAFGDLSDPGVRRHLIDRYLTTHRIKRLGLDLDALSETLKREGDSYESFFVSLMRFYARNRGKKRYGEKTPQHALYIETLFEWYPGCQVIHLVRDPRDVVASLLRMPWASNNVLANARIWLSHNSSTDRCHHRDNYLLAHYERLVSNPEAELTRVCRFLGESYSSEMLVVDEPPAADEWWFQRAQRPLSTDRLGKWREELNSEQVALIEWAAGSHMRKLGYELDGQVASLATRTAALGDELLDSVRRRLFGLPYLWYHWLKPTQLAREEAWIDSRA